MPGLLDITDDPNTAGLLSLGLRLMSTPGKFGTALGQAGLGAMGDLQQMRAAKQKSDFMAMQMEDLKQQTLLREQQAKKMADSQALLASVLGKTPQQNQYGLAGSGLTAAGVREPMVQQPGGLAGATPEQIAALKASGIDLGQVWELAKFGKPMQPGYRANADNTVSYFGDPTKGVEFNPATGQVSLMPGAAQTQGALSSAQAGGTEAGKAPYELVTVNMPDGSTRQMSKADALRLLGPKQAPNQVAAAAQNAGDQNYVWNVGGASGFAGDAGIGSTPNAQQRAAQEASSKYNLGKVEDILNLRKQAMNADFTAPGRIQRLEQIGQLLGNFEGGKLSPTGMQIASAANSLGLKIDKKLPNKEAAVAMSQEMALELRDPSSGAGMPGAMSDADRQYLASLVPNLAQSADGRRQIIGARVAVYRRQQEIAQFMRNYEKKYGQLDNEFFTQLSAWSQANPLFGGK